MKTGKGKIFKIRSIVTNGNNSRSDLVIFLS